MGGGGPARSGDSSSSEEEDANWKSAIESIAATTAFGGKVFGSSLNGSGNNSNHNTENDRDESNDLSQKPKLYQVKAQKLLDRLLEKTLEIVKEPVHVENDDPSVSEGGVRLFKHSPIGIIFDHKDEIQRPRKRPIIRPGQDIDEKSKEFRQRLRSVAVDGIDIITAAGDASKKSLARMEAKDAAAKEKAKREEERIAELKRIRGERWLPSIAREMKLNKNSRQEA